jgi:hypothetical protein
MLPAVTKSDGRLYLTPYSYYKLTPAQVSYQTGQTMTGKSLILNQGREFTKEEAERYQKSLVKLAIPTGKKIEY